jgi:hypothetical protein
LYRDGGNIHIWFDWKRGKYIAPAIFSTPCSLAQIFGPDTAFKNVWIRILNFAIWNFSKYWWNFAKFCELSYLTYMGSLLHDTLLFVCMPHTLYSIYKNKINNCNLHLLKIDYKKHWLYMYSWTKWPLIIYAFDCTVSVELMMRYIYFHWLCADWLYDELIVS